jgi:hypothetical protein
LAEVVEVVGCKKERKAESWEIEEVFIPRENGPKRWLIREKSKSLIWKRRVENSTRLIYSWRGLFIRGSEVESRRQVNGRPPLVNQSNH